MKRMAFLLGLLALICLSLPCSAHLQARRSNPQTPAQSANAEQLLKTAARHLQNKNFLPAYQAANQALRLSQEQGDKARQARATNLLALAAFHTGRMNEAIRLFKQASLNADEAGIGPLQTNALSRAGGLLLQSGRYADALFCFQQTLQLYRQRQDQAGEARALARLGAVFAETGDFAQAMSHLQRALPIARTVADQETEATVLRRLVAVEKGRGNWQTALQYGQQAQALLARVPAAFPHAELYYQLATVHAALEQPAKAAALFEQALRIVRTLRLPQPEALVLGDYAATQLKSGNAPGAREAAKQALSILQRTGGNKHLEARYHATLAEAQRKLGQPADALASYRAALAAIEEARAHSIPTEISRAGIVASRQQVFAGAIALLLNQARHEEAFEVAESYHARAFLDVLAETGLEAEEELTPAQQEREDLLFEQVSAIQRELWQPELAPEQEAQLKRQLAEAESALELYRLELRRADPRYASVKAPPSLGFARVAAELPDQETALVEFVLGEERSFAWVLQAGRLAAVTLPPRKELEPLVTAFRAASSAKVNSTTAAQAIAKLKAQSQLLYEKLFQPLEARLTAARKLIIVPDGVLAYLPFETLAGKTQRGASAFLLERFAISYAPSASALAALRALKTNVAEAKGLIAFGDPVYAKTETESVPTIQHNERGPDLRPLPYTRNEVNEIAALFPANERRVLLGAEATEGSVKAAALGQYRYVHFATHALVDEEFPARSAIVLSAPVDDQANDKREDGALQMAEVMRLKLNAELVTLSACRTGLGHMLYGEGIIGLTRAFLYAGAESVVVSLWNVNDIATASLMKAFYKNLRQGQNKDDALRQAKLELLRGQQPAWRHPYYWAPFVLVGAAR
ncbi:MAG: CHAT domain-containing protein [Acidobacteria bacterium]|nr:CHAT domain-containing protein [Acidobacteriota bacterium]MBI3423177.1 CHAT domain-containing protein [Acidobacteriota bacterium]